MYIRLRFRLQYFEKQTCDGYSYILELIPARTDIIPAEIRSKVYSVHKVSFIQFKVKRRAFVKQTLLNLQKALIYLGNLLKWLHWVGEMVRLKCVFISKKQLYRPNSIFLPILNPNLHKSCLWKELDYILCCPISNKSLFPEKPSSNFKIGFN